MNWWAFMLLAWIVLGLEVGLKSALALGHTAIAPSFVVPFATFVALCAQPRQAFWTCLILGLGLDLTSAVSLRDGGVITIMGPYALGLILGGQLVLAMRGIMMRQNPLTLVVLAVATSMVMHIIVIAIMSVRAGLGDAIAWDTTQQIIDRAGSSLYTGIAAGLMSLVLFPAAPILGFATGRHRISRAAA